MPIEPSFKRTVAFIDGQNLFHSAREAFGYTYPNYDPSALAAALCRQKDWNLEKVGFYTGYPDPAENPVWHRFWMKKLAVMGTRGVVVRARVLRYSPQVFYLPNGQKKTELVGREKGIDIRIALDIVRGARTKSFDVALLFSQDQDLAEVAQEIRTIAGEQDRWIKIASAYPYSPASRNKRGVNGTDWIRIDKRTYDACLDPNDYRDS